MAGGGGRGNHHFGGSWKIAYADFITSMFALFLVLWILSVDEETKRAIENYFRGKETQMIQGERGVLNLTDKGVVRTDPEDKPSKDLLDINEFRKAMEDLRHQLKSSAEIGEDQIRFEFNADGLRITAFDNASKPLFDSGSSELTPYGVFLMQTLGAEIERRPFLVEVEGHVQKDPDSKEGENPWELSTQRAMSAKAALTTGGVKETQYYRVTGYGDQTPVEGQKPESEVNRRIVIVCRPKSIEDVNKVREAFPQP